jgi:hypothetical protein
MQIKSGNKRLIVTFLLISLGLLGLSIFKSFFPVTNNIQNSLNKIDAFPNQSEVAMWMWSSPDELSIDEAKNLLLQAKKHGIDSIFLDISKYIDLYELPDSEDRTIKLLNFDNSIMQFIELATSFDISIHAASGNVQWSNPSHSYIPLLIEGYVNSYNLAHPDLPLKGIHYDIEYYNQENYLTNKTLFSKNYVNLLNRIIDRRKSINTNISLGVAIPFWLDGSNGDYIFNSIVHVLDNFQHSRIIIMAYRNYPTGQDGTINIVKNEFEFVDKYSTNIKIMIGQETGGGDIGKTTFFNMRKIDLFHAIDKIEKSYSSFKGYQGIAINDLSSFIELKD